MNKKLMAVAVAGALAAPALAMAQASTVQIYGRATFEYGIANQGSGRPNVDYGDGPGGANVGFKGEEALGGGLAAWFQCESSADIRGISQDGFCTRNSGIGLKGAFGNLHFGRWDTPMKSALNVGTVGAEETGLLGMSFVAFGGSGGANSITRSNRSRWKRRDVAMVSYQSPVFSGLRVLAAFTPGNSAADTAAVDATPNSKPRTQSIAALYANGPIGVGLGYEKHIDFNAIAGSGTDTAWGLTGAYTFGGNVKVGATYLDASYSTAPGRSLDKKTYTLGVDWRVAGPHSLAAQYAWAEDSKGNSLIAIGELAASGADTGARDWSVAYSYDFSKRSSVKLGYHKTSNDANARYKLGNTAALLTPGDSQSAWAMLVKHTF